MKKKFILWTILAVLILLLCIYYGYRGFGAEFDDVDFTLVDSIKIVDQGKEIISDDKELIEQFTSLLDQLVIRKSPPQLPATGYQYALVLYSGETRILTVNTYGANNRIDLDFAIYYARNPKVIEAMEKLIKEQYLK